MTFSQLAHLSFADVVDLSAKVVRFSLGLSLLFLDPTRDTIPGEKH